MERRRAARTTGLHQISTPDEPAATRYETISLDTGVPANVLEALGDDGFDPANAATRLAGPLAQGKKMGDSLAEAFPNATPERLARVKARALEIAGVPTEAPKAEEPPSRWAQLAHNLANPSVLIDPIGTATGIRQELVKGGASGLLSSASAGARALGAAETAKALGDRASAPELQPEVSDFRKIKGPIDAGKYVAGVLGQSGPEMAAVMGAAAGGAVVGGPVGAVGAGLATSALFNAGRNIQRQEQENPGQSPDFLRAYGAGLAQGGLDQIVPGHLGAGLYSRLLGAAGEGLLRMGAKVGKEAGIEAATETAQQLIEIAQAKPDLLRVMVNPQTPEEHEKSDQLVRELVDNAVGGAAAGGAFGAIHAASETHAPEAHEAPATAAAPTPGMAQERAAPAPAPRGPLEAAAQRGPAPILPDAKPGEAVTIQTPEEALAATVVGETPDGLRVNLDGEELVVPREQIESGEISVARPNAAPVDEAAPEVDAPSAPAAEQPAPVDAAPGPASGAVAPEEMRRLESAVAAQQGAAAPVPPLATGPASELAAQGAQWRPVREEEAPRAPNTIEEARRRLAFISDAGKTNGWTRKLVAERERAEARLAELEAAAAGMREPQPQAPAEAPPVAPAAPEGATTRAGTVAPSIPQQEPGAASQDALPTPEPVEASPQTPAPADQGAASPEPAAPSEPEHVAYANARMPEGFKVKVEPRGRQETPTAILYGPDGSEIVKARMDAYSQATADVMVDRATRMAEKAKPAPAAPAAPRRAPIEEGRPAPTIEPIREKAAVLRGVPEDQPPSVPGVSLKWDAKEGGWIFSRKHVDKVRAALGQASSLQDPQIAPAAAPDTAKPAKAKKEPPAAIVTQLNDDFGNWYVPEGSILKSTSGRALAPAPAFNTESNRRTKLSIRRQREWLVSEARAEAEARGDRRMLDLWLKDIDPGNFPRATADMVNEYLFGDAWGPAGDTVSTPEELATMDAAIDEHLAAKPTRQPSPPQIPPLEGMAPLGKAPEAPEPAKPSNATQTPPLVALRARLPEGYQAGISGDNVILGGPEGMIFEIPVNNFGPDEVDHMVYRAKRHAEAAAEYEAKRAAATSTPAEIAAARKDVDRNPTDGQKEAGNYAMGHVKVHGLDVTIETPKGGVRKGKAPDGTEWSVKMPADYGYIRRTEGADGDHVDVYVGPKPEADRVYVFDQRDPETGAFDEHKVVMGAAHHAHAREIYDAGFSDGSGPKRRMASTMMTIDTFKAWLAAGDMSVPSYESPAILAAKQARGGKGDGAIQSRTMVYHSGPKPAGPAREPEMIPDALRAQDWQPEGFNWKGSVGNFAYGYVGKSDWRVVDKRTGNVVGQASALNPASQIAERAHNAEKARATAGHDAIEAGQVPVRDARQAKEPERPEPAPKLPEGFFQTHAKPMTKAEAEGTGYPPRTIKAIITRQSPFSAVDGYGATVNEALEHAARKARAQIAKEPPSGPRVMVNIVGPDGLTDDERAAGKAPYTDPPAAKPAYGAGNKLVTADRAAELREKLKAKLRDQLNSGIDPEILAIGAELAVFHIEAGARSFSAMASAIADDLGTVPAKIRPYLRAWYNGARDMMEDAGHDVADMDSPDEVRKILANPMYAVTPPAGVSETPKPVDKPAENSAPVAEPASAPAIGKTDDAPAVAGNRDEAHNPETAPEEGQKDGLQERVPASDAEPGAGDAEAAPAEGPTRGSPRDEVGGGEQDVRGPDGERAETAERPAAEPGAESGGKGGARDADRVPGDHGQNHVIKPGGLDEGRGWKAKANDNITAIRLLRQIEAEGRPASAQEQEALARYVGWGGLASVFPDGEGKVGKGYETVAAELKELLSESEYATARRTTQYAHYTAETVVRSMWDAARRLGFVGGRVFEPGMGVGNFAGMMPADLAAATDYHGLELDPTTARIARLLYPKWGVRQDDFTRAPLPENAYDLVIGNPPFADVPIKSDPKYPQGFLLHDYFFAKSLDAVRPGGLLMFISSAGTLNKVDAKARAYLSERAEMVGAVRLPGDAFEKNAGTAVTTDIIVFRKFLPNEERGPEGVMSPWLDTSPVSLPDKNGNLKEGRSSTYFVEHPEMVLGEEGFFDKLYAGRYGVRSRPGANLAADLPLALAKLPADVMQPFDSPEDRAEVDFASSERKEGSYYLDGDGNLMQHTGGVGRAVERRGKGVTGGKTAAEIETIKALVPVRDALRAVYAADLAADEANGTKARRRLNAAYDAFTQRFGPINKAEISYRRPTGIQAESARAEAREEARYAGVPFREGSFDPASLITTKGDQVVQPSLQAIARARREAKLAAAEAGREWDEGTFDPEDMPDVVIDKRPNIEPFADDPEHYRLRAIEHYDDATGEAKKTDVFYRNVISRETEPDIRGVDDAVLYVLNTLGRFDLEAVAAAAKISPSEVLDQLGDKVFELPGANGTYLTSEEYLSGNVRQKLREAEAAAAKDTAFQRNVDALKAVQPIDLSPAQIGARLGMPWIPTDVVQEFATKHLGLSSFSAVYTPRLAYWQVDGDTDSAAATSDFGTSRMNATAILSAVLNKTEIKITDKVRRPDGGYDYPLNTEQTEAAIAKAQAIKEAFQSWVYADEARAERLAEIYNEGYNNLVVRKYDGGYLTTPGISTAWKWRPHQRAVVARIVQSGNTYMAHAVGAGKTSAMIGAGMEMRRLGLVKKPMYVVPNHMLGQFTKEFYEQYPTARIAVADERNFHTDRRKQFMANAAVSDLDAIIITHSSFGKIPVSPEFLDRMTQRELDEYRQLLGEMGNDQETRITRKKIEAQIEKMEQRLAGRANAPRDQVFTFEEMGVDFLFVDEAHMFRKLDFATKMGSLKGIDPMGSGMAWDLYSKVQYLETQNPGRSLVLASGTPITNTMAELYTLSRYIQPGELEARQISHFDAWSSAFGEAVAAPEQDAAGKYSMVTRFSKFMNLPALSAMVLQNVDVVTSKQLEKYVTRPKLKGGRRTMHLAERSGAFVDYQTELAGRIEAIQERKGPPEPGDDIILSVINDGRHAAIDMRFVDPDYKPGPDDPPSKLDILVDNVFATWEATKRQPLHGVQEGGGYTEKPVTRGPATQMIFTNLGLSGSRGFSTVQYIRAELVARGVPRDQIAYIADYKTHVARQRLFNDMNEGKVRILIGSVAKMGTGVNAQRRLYAIHNLDPLWYPADDEQRNGRGLRQGNMNPEIEINDYGLKGSYDSTMWQMMERKGRFIESFWNGDGSLTEMDDLGEAAFYEQAKALSTADPRVVQLTEMKQDLERIERRREAHAQEEHQLRRRIRYAESDAEIAGRRIREVKKDLAQRVLTKGDAFAAEIGGKAFDSRKEAGEALIAKIEKLTENPGPKLTTIGKIGGFPVVFEMWQSATLNGQKQWSFSVALDRNSDDQKSPRRSSFQVSESPVGTMQSAERIISGMEQELTIHQRHLAEAERNIAEFQKRMGKPFPDERKLMDLRGEVAELTDAIYGEPEKPAVVQQAEAEPFRDEEGRFSLTEEIAVSEPEADGTVAVRSGFVSARALGHHLAGGDLGGFVQGLVTSGRLVLHDRQADLPVRAEGTVQGYTDPDGTIHLVASNLNAGTARAVLLHEAFHAGGEDLVGEKAWRGLVRRLGTALDLARARAVAGTTQAGDWWDAALSRMPEGADAEELGAYAIENRENAPAGLREIVDNLVGRVKAFLLRRFGAQFGEVTPGQLRALAAGVLRAAPGWDAGDIDRAIGAARYSVAATDTPSEAQVEEAERGLIGHALTQAMAGKGGVSLLAMVPGRALFAELAGKLPAARTYLRAKEEMDALRHEWHEKFDATAKAWRKLLKGDASTKLMDLMHDTTLAGIDPSQPMEEGADSTEYVKLRARFEALPEAYRAMYERVRDDYKALNDEFEKTLLANIEKAQGVALRRAEQAHADRLREIADEGLAGREKADAIAEANRRLASVTRRSGWGKRAKAADLRKQFETQKVAAPYFPLARFGQYFVTARDKDGKVVHFSRHESPGVTPWIKAQRAVGAQTQETQAEAKAALEAQGLAVEIGTIGETSTRDMVDPQFVADIEGILADAGIPDGVMDAVWQRWLETLPDLSVRKSRIHRKGTPGYNPDAFRAYGFQMFHGSHQLARLRFASEMTEALEAAQRQAGKAEDPVRAGLIADEMKRRHDFVMNPRGAVWAQALSSAAFIYHLGMSPAAGVVNLTQTSIQGPAILGAYVGGVRGMGAAGKALARALRDFTDGKGWAMQSDRLTADEKAAMKEAYRRSIIDSSQAHDLAGVGETGVRYSDLRSKWMGRVSFFFHHAERLNREVTFLAAYRLAREKGLGSEAAIETAGDLTWRVHFDNQSSSKPRFMQNDAGKVLFIFRNFSANMLWRFFRDMHQSLNGATPEERREAATQFLGTTAMMALHAGVRGVWGYSVLMMLAGLLMGGDDDDAEDALIKGVVGMLGTTLGGAVLNGVPGTALGIDLTSRIGMPDLWFRSSDRQLEGDDERTYWWMQLMGAGVGMIDNIWRGAQLATEDGQYQRGIEAAMPKFARDLLKAGRYLEEGAAMNLRGDSAYIEDVSPYQMLVQSLGFTPAELAEQYERNSKLSNAQKKIEDRRTALMGAYARPAMRGEAVPQAVLDGIAAFNEEFPEVAITGKGLKASMASRRRSAEQKVHGVTLNPKLAPRLTREAAPAIYGE